MGTGKTRLAAELDLRLREEEKRDGRTLIVAPLPTHETWVEEMESHLDLPVERVDRKNRTALLQSKKPVWVVHHEALRLMPSLAVFNFQHVVIDECHRIANRKAKQTLAAKRIKGYRLTDMSGSPVTTKPQQLWSILNHLYPDRYTSYWAFFKKYVEWEMDRTGNFKIVTGVRHEWEEFGLPQIKPWISRHFKKRQCCPHHPQGVMPWLPDKVYKKIWVDLSDQQRRMYEQMKKDMIAWVGEQEMTPLLAEQAIAKLQRLQQIAIATLDIDPETGRVFMKEPSSKLDAVMEVLEDYPSEQFVIFSQFKAPLTLLERRFQKEGISYGRYTGDESQTLREDNKARFIKGDSRVFMGTIRAGGVGVDGLQHASANVVFLDRDWSPVLNEQGEDRLWRGGQARGVTVLDIMARGTVDMGKEQKLIMTAEWIRRMLG